MTLRKYIPSLLKLQTRELVRNSSNFVFVAIFPFFMAGIFLGMTYLIGGGNGSPDFRPIVMPMAIFLAVTGSGLQVTAGPIAELRETGALRTLSVTPLNRIDFLLTHLAIRFILGATQITIIIAVSVLLDLVSLSSSGLVLCVALIGLILFFVIGYLIGGTVSSSQLASNLATLIQITALFLSGSAIPFEILPDALVDVIKWIPTTLFAELIFWASDSPLQSVNNPLIVFLIVVVTIVILFATAVTSFKWDTEK